jgi:hypothetical protein
LPEEKLKRSCSPYNTLCEGLRPLIADASKPQINNLALFVYGLVMTGHVHLPKIALCLPVAGSVRNALQRLERFLTNKAIQPTQWYKGVARAVLACWKNVEIELIMDQTDLGDRFPLLFIAVAFRKRAIPILWRLLPHQGCSGFVEQKKLLSQVAKWLPNNTRIVLYADREYGSAELFNWLDKNAWFFVIRMKKDIWCKMANGRLFQIAEIPLGRGLINFEDAVYLSGLPTLRLSLNCGWSSLDPKDEAWYLLTNLPVGKDILNRYARRFWIEEMFRDFKEQGFRLDKTHLEICKRVSVLVMCVCIAYAWTMFLGITLEEAGKRREIDRPTKHQLSLFQFVIRYLQRLLARGEEMPRQFRLSSPKYEG